MLKRVLWIVIPAVLLALLVFIGKKKKKKEEPEDENKPEEKEEIPAPVKYAPDVLSMLSTAERYFTTGNLQSGLNQLYETLMAAILFKTELNREEASVSQINYRLRMKKIADENINLITSFLDELNTLRYQATDPESLKLSEKLEKTRKISLSLTN